MNKEFLDMRDFVKHNEFSVNENTTGVAVYREQLHRENGRNLNFKTQQQDICDFVNKLNNTVKEYELFIYWLKLNGFINDAILDTFQNILEYDNPMLRLINKELRDTGKALDVYTALQKFSGGV